MISKCRKQDQNEEEEGIAMDQLEANVPLVGSHA